MGKISLVTILSLIFILSGCSDKEKNAPEAGVDPVKIKIAWISPSNLMPTKEAFVKELKKNNLDGEIEIFDEFSYDDFTKARGFDLIFTNEFAAGFFLKLEKSYKIVGRSFSLRTEIRVSKKSKIKDLSELRGKTLGGAFAQFRTVIEALEKYGMLPSEDYYLINVGTEKQREIVIEIDKNKEISADQFSAMIINDPIISWAEEKDLGRSVYQDSTVFPILVQEEFIEKNPEAMINFFKAFHQALKIFRKDMIESEKVVFPNLDIELEKKILRRTLSYDSNYDEKDEKRIRFYFTKEEINNLQKTVDIIFKLPVTEPAINVMDYIDTSFAEKALERKIKEEQ